MIEEVYVQLKQINVFILKPATTKANSNVWCTIGQGLHLFVARYNAWLELMFYG